MMLKFLANDFTQDRWKTAALKNAYALLSKNRYGTSGLIAVGLGADEQNTPHRSSCLPTSPRMLSASV